MLINFNQLYTVGMNIAIFMRKVSSFSMKNIFNSQKAILLKHHFCSSISRTPKQYEVVYPNQSKIVNSFLDNSSQAASRNVDHQNRKEISRSSCSPPRSLEDDISLIKRKIAETGKSFELYYELGCLYQQSKHFRQSLTSFSQALKYSPNNAEVYNNMGVIFKRLGQNAQSFRAFSKALSLDDQNYQIYNNLGNFYLYELNDIQSAIKCFYNAANLTPELSQQYLKAGHLQSTNQRYWESLSFFINAYLRDIDNQSYANTLKDAFSKGQLIEQAKLFYSFLIENEIHSFTVFLSYGSLLFEKGDIQQCKKYLQKAQEINPEHCQNNLLLAIVQFQNGQLKSAVQLLEKCLKTNPNDANTLNYLGITNTKIGNLSKAKQYFTILLSIDPNDVVALTGIGSIQIDTNQIQEGIINLRKAIEVDSLYYPALEKLGNTLYLLGEQVEAESVLQTSRKIQELYRKKQSS